MKSEWPKLEYSEWKDTYETLHRWTQIVGKTRMCKSPWINHSWSSTLYITSRGLSTTAIPLGDRTLTIDFDLIDHQLILQDSQGRSFVLLLQNEAVASFYNRFMEALKLFDVTPSFDPSPNELSDATPFEKDFTHCTYNPLHAHNCFQAMVRVSNVFQEFRANFVGKSSPVHFFWGSFDLAVTRFSGKTAPAHPGGVPHLSDVVAREAYSHEVMSCGFWPGNEMYPHAAFYAYAYPEPEGFNKEEVFPKAAYYHKNLHEFILDYNDVIQSESPEQAIMTFLETTYEAASRLAHWDKDLLEKSPYSEQVRQFTQSSFGDEAIRQ